jgi:hypothetical protein
MSARDTDQIKKDEKNGACSMHTRVEIFSNFVTLHLPAYEDGTECSETSTYKIQKQRNYPEENGREETCVKDFGGET